MPYQWREQGWLLTSRVLAGMDYQSSVDLGGMIGWRSCAQGQSCEAGMGLGDMLGARFSLKAATMAVALVLAIATIGLSPASAESENPISKIFKKKQAGASQDDGAPATGNWQVNGSTGRGGPATTSTGIVNDGSVAPFLSANGTSALQAAETRYAQIVSAGGWGKVPGGKFKKGTQHKAVAVLNKRLFIEGYLRQEATEGQFADIYTSATEDAVMRFQRNLGLAATGAIDGATLRELNVPAERRLATIRANLPRVAEYSKDLGSRYVIVNVPAQQIEAVNDGKVYSIHNAIVGRPSRPTPVVITNLATVKFNPYWNAPASIVERDILPKMLSGGSSRVLNNMNMKVFDGVGGPEVDPDKINWRRVVIDNYHFRQEPGGSNAMATAKIEFDSPFGIYLHDTPEPELFHTGQRLYSSGCVRVEKVAILINWVLNGQDGIDNSRIAELAESKERLDTPITNPPQLRVAYLTAWPSLNGEVAFRPDVYQLDGTGFVLGQPLPDGETSGGKRYVLKPVPRDASAVDADEDFSFFSFGRSRNSDKENNTIFASRGVDDGDSLNLKKKNGKASTSKTGFSNWLSVKPNDPKKPAKKTASKTKKKVVKKSTGTTTAKSKSTDAAKTKKVAAKTSTETKTTASAKKSTGVVCKAGTDGKLPKGCTAATVSKPKPKPAADETTAAKRPAPIGAM